MLTVTSRTKGNPLVMANLLTTTTEASAPDVTTKVNAGFVAGVASGKKFAFSTRPGSFYRIENMETDALTMTWSDHRAFVAMATVFKRNGVLIISSDTPVTFEHDGRSLKYNINHTGKFTIGVVAKPLSIILNGVKNKNFTYDKDHKVVIIEVPKGEGIIVIN